jgi:hypothetical protein
MTLRELEKILMNITIDASTVGNAQYSMIIGATINMLKSVETLSTSVYSIPFNDSCKTMMIQKMAELESYTSNSIMLRIAELGIDISMYTGFEEFAGGRVPAGQQQSMMRMQQPMMMQQPMQMAQAPMPAAATAPVQPAEAPPAPTPEPAPAATPPPTPPPAAPPQAPEASAAPATPAPAASGGTGATLSLPGMGAKPDAAGPAYLLKVISGEI